jgi:NAD(P)-dependent dehydrogenase (short-subunit alcohol dehydrogenase family)
MADIGIGYGSMQLAPKVAIVTGAGSRAEGIGNGRAASILLARAGARVVLVDANEPWAARTKEMIEREGGESLVVQADVTSQADCGRIVATAVARYGRVDILVNNVGIIGARGTAVEVDLAEWNQGLLVNVTSMMLMAKVAIPEMLKQKGGSIVNIASVAGLRGGAEPLVSDREGRNRQHDTGHGRSSWPRQHPGELRLPRDGVYADDVCRRHVAGDARGPPPALGAQDRGHRLGHRRCRALPGLGQCALDDGRDPAGRCRHHRGHSAGGSE